MEDDGGEEVSRQVSRPKAYRDLVNTTSEFLCMAALRVPTGLTP